MNGSIVSVCATRSISHLHVPCSSVIFVVAGRGDLLPQISASEFAADDGRIEGRHGGGPERDDGNDPPPAPGMGHRAIGRASRARQTDRQTEERAGGQQGSRDHVPKAPPGPARRERHIEVQTVRQADGQTARACGGWTPRGRATLAVLLALPLPPILSL